MNKNYYFDMDGVLVKYGVHDYEGESPTWLKKNLHYFRNLEPDMKALKVADDIWRQCQTSNDRMYILTSLSPQGAIFNEHMHDKILWLHEWMPYMSIENILISVTTKRDAVEYICGHELTENDILIDDYNKNLVAWKEAGGTSVKYCNGINSAASWDGNCILPNASIKEAYKLLTGLHF